jgi:hypothetical protein
MSKPFDLLGVAAAFAKEHGIPLNDPSLVDRFMTAAAPRLTAALRDSALIQPTTDAAPR